PAPRYSPFPTRRSSDLQPPLNLKLVFFIRAGKFKTIFVVFKTDSSLPGLGRRHFLSPQSLCRKKQEQKYRNTSLLFHSMEIYVRSEEHTLNSSHVKISY